MAGPRAAEASAALARHLADVLGQLEPVCLGTYWPYRSEFNPALALDLAADLHHVTLALPFCRREPRAMHYRRWDGREPEAVDEFGLATASGAVIEPDVVLSPCVGFNDAGFRLGYGGGFFDRYLAAHPGITVVGVGLEIGRLDATAFAPEPHDQPLMLVVTEGGIHTG
jgi:5,10-methenyltetrahydrofolate synthetase